MEGDSPLTAVDALARRLAAVTALLIDAGVLLDDNAAASDRLLRLIDAAHRSHRDDLVWLLLVTVVGSMPDEATMRRVIAQRDNLSAREWASWLLAYTQDAITKSGSTAHELIVIRDSVLVDVDACAKYNRHTGIQRVVRETLPRWEAHPFHLLAWAEGDTSYRALDDTETARVLDWPRTDAPPPETASSPGGPQTVIVPWNCRIVLPEITNSRQSARLAALASHTGNTLGMIGYDLIPVLAPEFQPRPATSQFSHYLSVVRRAKVVAGISRTATAEFAGLIQAADVQSNHAVTVVECALPLGSPPDSEHPTAAPASTPLVLSVGSHEPRKNQVRVLEAAERLWQSGKQFSLLFLGGPGWGTYFAQELLRLQRAGRPVDARSSVTDAEVAAAYRAARFTVFPSLYEGYGLPVAESLAAGTPVITSNYGATAEVARQGGTLTVDPRSVSEIERAMGSLLESDATLDRLHIEARAFQPRSWQNYADELWDLLADSRRDKR